ncbi:MAG TPA: hypothetical protein VG965_00090 [Patescibacteria group bacterium]|nr:hypothetical protein [Patescibacteria group bacterium]
METIISGIVSFFLFHFATHPNSRLNKKLTPKVGSSKKIGSRVEFFPRFNIEAKNKKFHVHHWMIFAPLLIVTQTVGRGIGFLQSDIAQGFMIGGLLQGLLYQDSLKIVHQNKDYHKKITQGSYRRVHPFKRKKK